MPDTVQIPWLHDRHSHASLYASLIGCPALAGMNTGDALAVLRALDFEHLSVVFGWHSAVTPLGRADLKDLPPAVIVNISMHGFALTDAALPLLADRQPELVAHQDEAEWAERNLPQLLEFYCRTAGLTPEKLTAFVADLERVGLGSVDDMLIPGEDAYQVIRQSRWGADIQCWATPRTHQTLSPPSRDALAGLKFFTDGAIGSRTAALRGTFRDGRQGLLLYDDGELLGALGECHGSGKPVAIHAIGDRAIEQVLRVLERLDRDGMRFPLVRMEHAQFIDEIQARRARDLGGVRRSFTSGTDPRRTACASDRNTPHPSSGGRCSPIPRPKSRVALSRGRGRRRPLVSAAWLAVFVLLVVQNVRLGRFMADPSADWWLTTKDDVWAKHACTPAYIEEADLHRQGVSNVYDGQYYAQFNRAAEPPLTVTHLDAWAGDRFQYPPQFLMLSRAALALTNDYLVIRTWWYGIEALAFIAVVLLLAGWVGGPAGMAAALLIPVMWLSVPVMQSLQYGQFHLMALLLAMGGMMALENRRDAAGGALLAAAVLHVRPRSSRIPACNLDPLRDNQPCARVGAYLGTV